MRWDDEPAEEDIWVLIPDRPSVVLVSGFPVHAIPKFEQHSRLRVRMVWVTLSDYYAEFELNGLAEMRTSGARDVCGISDS